MNRRMRIRREEEKETVLPSAQNETPQRSPFASQQGMDEVPSIVGEVVSSSGQPLDSETRAYMEPRFGHDFSEVRIHTDERAVESAQAVNALAYTVGQDIVFGDGQYAPASPQGQRLLAHELVHTIQQESLSQRSPSTRLEVTDPQGAGEREAETTAQAGMQGQVFNSIQNVAPQIARQGPPSAPVASPPASSPPTSFRAVATAHGTFNVYPDEFAGPLPVSDYVTQGWPVRQSVFNRIEAVINVISGGTGKITIGGDNSFKTSVLTDLAWLMTVNVGQDLLQAITASGKTLTINPTSGGNSTSYTPDADSYEQSDGTPGPGANVTINYNTTEWNPYGGTEDWMRRPPAIGLAHEMVHAWTGMIGTRALGETAGVRRRELQATGLGEFSAAAYSENRFRQAFGLPLRPHY